MATDKQAASIYDMLGKQRFVDWYERDFVSHIEGGEDCKSKDEILADIKGLAR